MSLRQCDFVPPGLRQTSEPPCSLTRSAKLAAANDTNNPWFRIRIRRFGVSRSETYGALTVREKVDEAKADADTSM